jgi:hypothetical protein
MISLKFDRSPDDGGAIITDYELEFDPLPSTGFTKITNYVYGTHVFTYSVVASFEFKYTTRIRKWPQFSIKLIGDSAFSLTRVL